MSDQVKAYPLLQRDRNGRPVATFLFFMVGSDLIGWERHAQDESQVLRAGDTPDVKPEQVEGGPTDPFLFVRFRALMEANLLLILPPP